MGCRIVNQPNGKLAEFSDVVDDFTAVDMSRDESIAHYAFVMSEDDAVAKVRRGIDDEPIEDIVEASSQCDGLDRYRRSLLTVYHIHGREVCRERHRQLSRRATDG